MNKNLTFPPRQAGWFLCSALALIMLLSQPGRINAQPDHHHGHSMPHGVHPDSVQRAVQSHHHNPAVVIPEKNASQPDQSGYSHLPKPVMGEHELIGSVIVDRLEMVNARNDFSTTYDWQAWLGKDYNKALVRAEGEIDRGSFKNARNELLWAHALTPYWDSQLGIRYDSGRGRDRAWGAFGLQGYAPYWVYVEATAYIGEGARTAFRLELEYDLLITQKLILQPRIEMNFYSQRDPSRLISSGLSNIEAGLRLRYEFIREFAPYIGIEWASTFGSAADSLRNQHLQPEEARFIAGVHFWF